MSEQFSTQEVNSIEQSYFDRLVTTAGDFNPFADRGWQTLERRFEEWVRPASGVELLDVGAGTGQSRQIYISHTSRYVGVDLSAEAIRMAQARFPDSEWIVADACQLDLPDLSFDVVAFSSVLHHIPDFVRALREARRVLRPGGKVFAFDPNLLHPAMALFRWPKSPFYSSQGVSPNESPLLPRVLRTAFREAGFTALRQRCQSDIPYRAVAPRLANSCLAAFNAVDRLWEYSGIAGWFGTFVLTYGEKPSLESQAH